MVEEQPAAAEADVAEEGDRNAPRRTCAVTRSERLRDALIRFVAAPDGTVVPDLKNVLPGRGVWVTADRTSIAAAVRAKVFARGFKRQVSTGDDLPATVELALTRRLEQALALANKAGLVVPGFEKIEAEIEKGRLSLLLHGSDAADGGRDKLDRKFRAVAASSGRNALVADLLTIDQMSLAMGRTNVVHAGLKHGGSTDRVWAESERLRRYRSGMDTSG